LDCNFQIIPDLKTQGDFIEGENVLESDRLDNVPAYINAQTIVGSSFYQSEEFVARYLNSIFNTEYSETKKITNSNNQGFQGLDFQPDYDGTSPLPTIRHNGHLIELKQVMIPQKSDIVIIPEEKRCGIVKSIENAWVTLIEQNLTTFNLNKIRLFMAEDAKCT